MNDTLRKEAQSETPEQGERERIKNSLLQEGFEVEDIETTVRLIEGISKLNTLVFGDEVPFVCVKTDDPSDKERIASYREPNSQGGIKESYYVFVRGVVGNIELSRKRLGLWFDKDGKIRNGEMEADGQPVNFNELLFGVAAHEVRHRVQQSPNFKKVDVSSSKETESDARITQYKSIRAMHAGKPLEEIAKIIEKLE